MCRPEYAATGFALASMLTSEATPFLYEVINDRYKDIYPWLAMVSIMSLKFVAVPFRLFLRFKETENLKKIKEKKIVIMKN